MRLLLGQHAVESMRDRLRFTLEEIEDWKHLYQQGDTDVSMKQDREEGKEARQIIGGEGRASGNDNEEEDVETEMEDDDEDASAGER